MLGIGSAAGGPIQVDVIDLETDSDVVSIEVFNRAIALVHADTHEMRRIHRVCGVLEAATQNGADRSTRPRDAATAVAVMPPERARPAEDLDLTDVLKAHRRQGGTCALCGEGISRVGQQNAA